MKKKLVPILLLMLVGVSYGQNSWKKDGVKVAAPVCYASPEVHQSFIGPPLNLKSGTVKKATILVDFVGFPDNAKQAFQRAIDIWQDLIYSPVPIHVRANWKSLDKDVLGSCSPANYFRNFNSTEVWNCYYPVALVEKMLGEEVNSVGEYEIEANFNSDFGNWYYGIDGKTPSNKYDLVSTVLHELTHGLGFTGFFTSVDGKGGYGYSDSFSAAFDQFVVNKAGQKLVDTKLFVNPSVALNLNLTSGWLEFNTKLAETKLPRLYAPATWDDGSSIYHLDENTYPAGDPNSLMTYAAGMGEAIHDPGPKTLAIMYDMGWKSISIEPKPLKDIESVTGPINFEAQIESDYELDLTRLFLVYSFNNFAKTDSILLTGTTTPGTFNAQLTSNQDGDIRYYFAATDVKTRRFVFPSNPRSRYLSLHIGIDNELPVVIFEPIKQMLSTHLSAHIDAKVTDNLGVGSVNLEYFINGGGIKTLALQNTTPDHYSGDLVFAAGSVKGGDQISYRIVAVDASLQNNIGKSPLSGFNTFLIEDIRDPVEKYVSQFDTPNSDFIGTDFKIEKVIGFDSSALNSKHPYPSSDTDNMNFNFSTILRYPVILKAGGKMTFDEIVLVEPGEAGNQFGDANFWDYVIVEGSADDGINWNTLADGYDSNTQGSWLNLFNSSMSGNNSTAVPTKDLFVKHEIDLLSNGHFKAGETILIRFRLFSDPYSHGWGWIVDNLAIQDFRTAVNPLLLSSGELMLYPNPATESLNLRIQGTNTIHQLLLKVYNSLGQMVYNQSYPVDSNLFQTSIDVSQFSPGLYLFATEPDNGQVITRKILIR